MSPILAAAERGSSDTDIGALQVDFAQIRVLVERGDPAP
jgi:hypothetical protein